MTDKQKQQMMIRLFRKPKKLKCVKERIFIKWEYKYFNTVNLILRE